MSHQIDVKALIAAAKAAAEVRKSRPTENFWPTVKNWLQTNSGLQPLPTCPVCYCELDVKGIGPVPPMTIAAAFTGTDDADADTDTNDHDDTADQCGTECASDTGNMAVVLPCGHMTCHRCTEKSLYTAADNHLALHVDDEGYWVNEISCCPVCRAMPRGQWEGCNHHVHYHVPTRAMDASGWIQNVPLTTPEGGSIPDLCLACGIFERVRIVPDADANANNSDSDSDSNGSDAHSESASNTDSSTSTSDSVPDVDDSEDDKDEVVSLQHPDASDWVEIIPESEQVQDSTSPATTTANDDTRGIELPTPTVTIKEHCCYYSCLLKRKVWCYQTHLIVAAIPFHAHPGASPAAFERPDPEGPALWELAAEEWRVDMIEYLRGLDQVPVTEAIVHDDTPIDPALLHFCIGRAEIGVEFDKFTERVDYPFPTMVSWTYKRSVVD